MRKVPDDFVEDPVHGSYFRFPDGLCVFVKDGKSTPVPPHRRKVVVAGVYGVHEMRWNPSTECEEWVLIEEIERLPEPKQPVLVPMPKEVKAAIDALITEYLGV